jgi:hypothetical protein
VAFEQSDLAAMAAAEEVDIETRAATGETHRTIIWIVVRDGEVYIRSYRGDRGRWYREATADPEVAIHVDGRRVAARAVAATDPASVAACSAGLAEKYEGDPATPAMLADAVLATTLRLVPA